MKMIMYMIRGYYDVHAIGVLMTNDVEISAIYTINKKCLFIFRR